jgi:hypothetical protein
MWGGSARLRPPPKKNAPTPQSGVLSMASLLSIVSAHLLSMKHVPKGVVLKFPAETRHPL